MSKQKRNRVSGVQTDKYADVLSSKSGTEPPAFQQTGIESCPTKKIQGRKRGAEIQEAY